MIEYVLVVWMYVAGGAIAPAFEVGTYRDYDDCKRAESSIVTGSGISHVSACVARDK